MRNNKSLIGIITLLIIVTFTMVGCDGNGSPFNSPDDNGGGSDFASDNQSNPGSQILSGTYFLVYDSSFSITFIRDTYIARDHFSGHQEFGEYTVSGNTVLLRVGDFGDEIFVMTIINSNTLWDENGDYWRK